MVEDAGFAVTREDAVALVTLQRPKRMNAFDVPTIQGLREAVQDLTRDPEVRALVLTGEGDRAFCAGGDVHAMREAHERGEAGRLFSDLTEHHHPLVEALVTGDLPVVTAVNGVAAGGGLGLALAGDLRYASPSASFRAAYPQLGVVPDGGATWLLPRIADAATAQRMLLLDEVVEAEEAASLGMVHEVVDASGLLEHALEAARTLADQPAFTVARLKRLLHGSLEGARLNEQLDRERRWNRESADQSALGEGLDRVLGGDRPPRPGDG